MEHLYTRQEVAEILKVHVRTVDRMIYKKDIPVIHISNRIIRIPESSLQSILSSKTLSATEHKDIFENIYKR